MNNIKWLIEKWELELHYYKSAYNVKDVSEISNDVDRGAAIVIRNIIKDLKKLNEGVHSEARHE